MLDFQLSGLITRGSIYWYRCRQEQGHRLPVSNIELNSAISACEKGPLKEVDQLYIIYVQYMIKIV